MESSLGSQSHDSCENSTEKCSRNRTRTKNKRSLRTAEISVQNALRQILLACDKNDALTANCPPTTSDPNDCLRLDDSVLDELHHLCLQGMFDSIWPYLETALSMTPDENQQEGSRSRQTEATPPKTIKKNQHRTTENNSDRCDVDVEIQVLDSSRPGGATVFHCRKSALLRYMPYFGTVVSDADLPHVDISVHCDVAVFQWLIDWIDREDKNGTGVSPMAKNRSESDEPPLAILLSVLSAAEFLHMKPLVEQCLITTAMRMSQVIRTSGAICVSNKLASKLAQMVTHRDMEEDTAQKQPASSGECRLREQLYMHLVQQQCGKGPAEDSDRVATALFPCSHCHQLLIPTVAAKLACQPGRRYHQRPEGWQPEHLVSHLYKRLGNWRLVYWQMWATIHWLDCGWCCRPFPLCQWNNCRRHTRKPKRCDANGDGEFPCCGRRVLVANSYVAESDGCSCSPHQPEVSQSTHQQLLVADFHNYRHLVTAEDTKSLLPIDMFTNEDTSGLGLFPEHARQQRCETEATVEETSKDAISAGKRLGQLRWSLSADSAELDTTTTGDHPSVEEEDSGHTQQRHRRPITAPGIRHVAPRPSAAPPSQEPCWSEQRSIRYNQHAQRRRERADMRRLVAIAAPEMSQSTCNRRSGGSYVLLEAQFREQHSGDVRDRRSRKFRRGKTK